MSATLRPISSSRLTDPDPPDEESISLEDNATFFLRFNKDFADKPVMVRSKPGERGATLLMVAFVSAFVLIPLIGICIDGAYIYLMKSRLSAAVDASALATGRALSVGQTSSAQIANAINVGQMYFKANFPNMVINRNGKSVTVSGTANITVNDTVAHVRTVTVTASANFPLFFMPILAYPNQLVSATGQATRRDANIMLVLDRSNSMNNSAGSCGVLVASAQNFVNQFVDGRDRLGLVTFQTGANVDYAPTLYFKSSTPSLATTLGTLVCAGDTSTAQGLYLGYNQITTAINQPGSLNVILFFTDGSPNGLVANFPIKNQWDMRYDSVNTSTLTSVGPSGCYSSDSLVGVIADGSQMTSATTDVTQINATGYTVAVLSSAGVPITSSANPVTISASGCAFPSSNWQYSIYGRQDVANIPSQDIYGNSTLNRGMVPNLDVFPSGYTYAGLIRPDMPRTVRWASFNAADSQAQTIRNNSTYNTIIYSIGLAGNEPMAMDQDFMERVANDPRASNYDSTKPQGQFILASSTSQLAQAFQQVASQILRLSK